MNDPKRPDRIQFKETHRLRYKATGDLCDALMRVETPGGVLFYTRIGCEQGLVGLAEEDLPSFDIVPSGEPN